MTRSPVLLFAAAASLTVAAVAQEDNEDAGPDLSFLEYLGSWDDSDEDWELVVEFEEEIEAEVEKRSEASKKDDEAEETDEE